MARYYIDCRDHPSDMNCTVALLADTEEELLEATIQHAAQVHGHEDTFAFREQMRREFKRGGPHE